MNTNRKWKHYLQGKSHNISGIVLKKRFSATGKFEESLNLLLTASEQLLKFGEVF